MNNYISIILPAYKTPKEYLQDAISSVICQTYTYWELLIIDDCPSEPVEYIVKSYNDKRIKYLLNTQNIGIANSRNRGLQLAQGEFIALLDHDDIWLPQKLEEQIKVLKANSSIGLVYSPIIFFDKNKEWERPQHQSDSLENLLLDNYIITCSNVLLRQSILSKHHLQFEQKYVPADDYMLWLKVSLVSETYRLKTPLLKYRIHSTNFSSNLCAVHKVMNAIYAEFIKVFQAECRHKKFNIPKVYYNFYKSNSWACRTIAMDFIKEHKFITGIKYMILAIYFKLRQIILSNYA